MPVVLLAVLGGLLGGWFNGGRLHCLGELRLRRALLVVAAVVVQAAGAIIAAGGSYALGLVASALLAGAFLALNRSVQGLGLVAGGFALNALAVAVNRGLMPVSLSALSRIGDPSGAILDDGRHVAGSATTLLRPLTDVVAVPLPWGWGQVLSAGDVLVAAGCALLVFAGMRCSVHGQEGAQAPRTQEQQGQPREASERLTVEPPATGGS